MGADWKTEGGVAQPSESYTAILFRRVVRQVGLEKVQSTVFHRKEGIDAGVRASSQNVVLKKTGDHAEIDLATSSRAGGQVSYRSRI